MTPSRLLAVAIIYVCTAVAWFTLGGSVVRRTGEADETLAKEVEHLWGGRHVQIAPHATLHRERTVVSEDKASGAAGPPAAQPPSGTVADEVPVALASSRVSVSLKLDQRRKGLLWYDTYSVDFGAHYRLKNAEDTARALKVHVSFPSAEAIYDGFLVRVNGVDASPADDLSRGVSVQVTVPSRGEVDVEVAYRSRGLGPWYYALSPSGIAQVRDFELKMTTDFSAIDFPGGTLSPTTKAPEG